MRAWNLTVINSEDFLPRFLSLTTDSCCGQAIEIPLISLILSSPANLNQINFYKSPEIILLTASTTAKISTAFYPLNFRDLDQNLVAI
jgi:hypothetical protein